MMEQRCIQSQDQPGASGQKLMVSGLVGLELGEGGMEVRRGMAIFDWNGQKAGVVAAVVMDCRAWIVTHILLGQIPPTADYRLVPLDLIAAVDGEAVRLRILTAEIPRLPCHQPD